MNVHQFPTAHWPHLPVFSRPFPERLEDLLSKRSERGGKSVHRPLINVWSDGDALHLDAELPGLSIEDIELTVQDDELTLSGQHVAAPVDEGVTMLHEERRIAAFERRLKLPFEVDADAVTAELKHGVLHVTLPRSEAVKPRRIPVQLAGE